MSGQERGGEGGELCEVFSVEAEVLMRWMVMFISELL